MSPNEFDYVVASAVLALLLPQFLLFVSLFAKQSFSLEALWGSGALWLQAATIMARNVYVLHSSRSLQATNMQRLYFSFAMVLWIVPVTAWIYLAVLREIDESFAGFQRGLASAGVLYLALVIYVGMRQVRLVGLEPGRR